MWFHIQCPGVLGAWVQFPSLAYFQVIKSSFSEFYHPSKWLYFVFHTLQETCALLINIQCTETVAQLNMRCTICGRSLAHLHKSSEMFWSLTLLVLFPAFKEFISTLDACNSCSWYLIIPSWYLVCFWYMTYNPIWFYSLSNGVWCLHSWCESMCYSYQKLNNWWSICDMPNCRYCWWSN